MTRCCKDNLNLKSSVYNQTGQSYVEQVSQHRRMCTHLRRVIHAKCVVEARNPRFTCSLQKRGRPSSCRLRFSEDCPSDDTIDRLAYDSQHHPSEIVRVSCRSKSSSSSKERSCSRCRQILINDAICSCSRQNATTTSCRGRSQNRATREPNKNPISQQVFLSNLNDYSPQRGTSCRKFNNNSRVKKKIETTVLSCGRNARPGSSNDKAMTAETFQKLAERKGDEARYAKFVYDITQEIVQNGLYTNRELKEVFERHLEKNSGHLNKRKMLYELYQLKISLNMSDGDEEEEDEEETDLIYAERFSKLRIPKPPTPPKILNENKVIEKLDIFKQRQSFVEKISNSGATSPTSTNYPNNHRNVVLVDPNPEFLVTEHDVLATLADEDVSPQQIQRIYRNLFQRSKDVSLCEPLQVGNEVMYSHRLKKPGRCSSASSIYTKERLRGILRKEGTDFAMKSLSPESMCRNYVYLNRQKNETVEKCEKYNLGLCPCDKQPYSKNPQVSEKKIVTPKIVVEKDQIQKKSPTSAKDQKYEKNQKLKSGLLLHEKNTRPSTASSRVENSTHNARKESKNFLESSTKGDKKNSTDSSQKATQNLSESAKKENESPAQIPERAISKIILEEKQQPVKIDVDDNKEILRAAAVKSPSVDEHEEIEEEIDNDDIEEPSSSQLLSPKKSPTSEKSNEDKYVSNSKEKQMEIKKEPISVSDYDDNISSDDSYSTNDDDDDYSVSSGSARSIKTVDTSASQKNNNEVRRYSTVQELYERIANARNKEDHHQSEHGKEQMWNISEGSSDTISLASEHPSIYLRSSQANDNDNNVDDDKDDPMRPTMRKRTSSGVSGYKVTSKWNHRLSEITSDFYKSQEAKFCEPGCRGGASGRGCAENCKFVRTNCRNLSDPTSCLIKTRDNYESTSSSDSS